MKKNGKKNGANGSARRTHGTVAERILEAVGTGKWHRVTAVAREKHVTAAYVIRVLTSRGVKFERRPLREGHVGRPATEVRVLRKAA